MSPCGFHCRAKIFTYMSRPLGGEVVKIFTYMSPSVAPKACFLGGEAEVMAPKARFWKMVGDSRRRREKIR